MPIYDYACGGCGEFSALRPLAQWRDPADCPQCGASSERIVGGAPAISALSSAVNRARGERTQRQRAAQLARRPRHELRLLLGRTQVRQDPGGGGRRQIFRRLPLDDQPLNEAPKRCALPRACLRTGGAGSVASRFGAASCGVGSFLRPAGMHS